MMMLLIMFDSLYSSENFRKHNFLFPLFLNYLLMIIRHLLLQRLQWLLQIPQSLLIFIFIIMWDMEGCDNVFYLLAVSQREVLQVPVVDDEGQVVLYFYLLGNFITATESVSHDGDQHV